MHPLDVATVLAYLAVIIGLGAVFGRNQSRREFFAAGGTMGWFTVGLSVMATLFSSNSFVFYPAAAFGDSLRIGLSLVSFTLMTPLVVWIFIPVYSRLNVETAYEYLERRFHVSVRTIASGLFILLRIGWMASATHAAAVVVSSLSGIDRIQVILGLGIISVGYTMLGGLRAVMWTDVIQFFVFAATIIAAVGLIVARSGMEPATIWDTYTSGRQRLLVDFEPSMTLAYGSWAILIGVFLEGLSAFGVDQVAVQRYISARSERTSQWGAVLNLAGMWIVIPGLLCIGVCLYGYYVGDPSELGEGTLTEILASDGKVADRAFPTFVRNHFPPILAGLFLAALMAAIMSSIDSGIHSVTTALVVDFRDRLFPSLRPQSEARELQVIRCLVILVGSVAILLACFVGSLGNVFDIGKKLTAAFGGPLLAIFVLALFSKRATWLGVLFSAVASTCLTLWLMYTQTWFAQWYWPIGFGSAIVMGYVASLFQARSDTDFTFRAIMRRK